MMRGYVLAFRPATGEGTLVTDSGEMLKFARRDRRTELQGGDVVTFCVPTAPARPRDAGVYDVEVVQKWSDHLSVEERAGVRELYTALHSGAAVH